MDNPKIFLIIIVMIIISNIVSLLVFNTINDTQILNDSKPQSNFTGQEKAFRDIEYIRDTVDEIKILLKAN
jgi:hypothetical protein